MGKRRKGREIVLQACYASRVAGTQVLDCLEDQIERRRAADDSARFSRELAAKKFRVEVVNKAFLDALSRTAR